MCDPELEEQEEQQAMRTWSVTTSILITCLVSAVPFASAEPRTEVEPVPGVLTVQSARDEITRSVTLTPGATVRIGSINGPVTIETIAGDTAQIHLIRSAHSQSELSNGRVEITESSSELSIMGIKNRSNGRSSVTHSLELRLPRSVSLDIQGVNGAVDVGEIEGKINLKGINGRVELERATSSSILSGINGSVDVTLVQISPEGLDVRGINGGVEIRIIDRVDANLKIRGINGSISTELSNLTIQGKVSSDSLTGIIGSGGPLISVSGVNGRVRIVPAYSGR